MQVFNLQLRCVDMTLKTYFFLLFFVLGSFSAEVCLHFYEKSYRVLSRSELAKRQSLTLRSHQFHTNELLAEMNQAGLLIYQGKHKYQSGTEFLASNEFDWSKTPMDRSPTDVVVGFGTNSVWDIALRKNAKQMIIGDWSPWPLISQAFLISPLMRIAESPQEFLVMISGMPKVASKGKTIEQVFEIAQIFSGLHPEEKRGIIEILLMDLAKDSRISELELKFLTTYFRPMYAENIHPLGWGPFEKLRHPQFANLISFYSKRYNPVVVGEQDSIFSTQENYSKIKRMYTSKQVKYALTSITDLDFYQQVVSVNSNKGFKDYTFSVSNVFDCGCYNGLSFKDFQLYLKKLMNIVQSPITVFRTTNNTPPHGYYRYQINSDKDIPFNDEYDSSALSLAN